MAEWYDKLHGEQSQEQVSGNPFGVYSERDVTRERAAQRSVEEVIRSAGFSEAPGAIQNQALINARIQDVSQRLSSIQSLPVPTGMNPQSYYDHQETTVRGSSPSNQHLKKTSQLGGGGFQKQGYYFAGGAGGFPELAQGGMPVYTDPTNSPNRFGIPTLDERMPEEVKAQVQADIRYLCNWYYTHHHVVGTCVMIYATYPFVGLDIQCPDPQVEDEYRQMFFNRLNYEELLPKASLQYWKSGEAPMFGEWDASYGGWVREKILNPDDVSVVSWPGPETDEEAYFWTPPESLRNTLLYMDTDNPIFEYYIETFGEDQVQDWMEGKPSELPGDLFSLLRWDQPVDGNRGYPILQRAFDILLKEEKLNQAMTAVADRLYTPFIVAKLGSKDLLQGQYPWIPTEEDLKRMQAHIEMVMTSRYRVMTYHSGIEFENPFANQTIPDLNDDLDRTRKDIMGVFGIPEELVYGGSAAPYASGAISAEIMMRRLSTSQQVWSRWWIQDRAKKVAEAQGYYTVERKGLTYTKPMERVLVRHFDGTQSWETRRKLMLPSIRYETMDFRDKQNTFQQAMNLKKSFNVPISNQYLMDHIDPNINLETQREAVAEELEADHLMRTSLQQAGIPTDVQGGGGAMGGPPGMGGMGMPPGGGGRPPGMPRPAAPGTPGAGAGGMDDINGMNPNGPAMPTRPPQSGERMPGDLRPAAGISLNEQIKKLAASRKELPTTDDITTYTSSDLYKGGKTASFEDKMIEERIARNGGLQRYAQHGLDFRKGQLESNTLSYAESHKFYTFKTTGKQKGTLYSMDGDYLSARRVK